MRRALLAVVGSTGAAAVAYEQARDNDAVRRALPNAVLDRVDAGPDLFKVAADGVASLSRVFEHMQRTRNPQSAANTISSGLPAGRWQGDKEPQTAVVSPLRSCGLFLTVHLERRSDLRECAALSARAVTTSGPLGSAARGSAASNGSGDADAECAIGYSERVWGAVRESLPGTISTSSFAYGPPRKGDNGVIPATGGDIFLHVKSDSPGACFEVARRVLESLPRDAVVFAEDTSGFKLRHSRDFTGFELHTVNPSTTLERCEAALVPETGGSYVLFQRWEHRLGAFAELSEEEQEAVIGKRKRKPQAYLGDVDLAEKPDELASAVRSGLPAASHVARVMGVDPSGKRLAIVRQSLPCGTVASPWSRGKDRPGLAFVAYSSNPVVFRYMLDRLAGVGAGGSVRGGRFDMMRYSSCVRGALFFVPSRAQLNQLAALRVPGDL